MAIPFAEGFSRFFAGSQRTQHHFLAVKRIEIVGLEFDCPCKSFRRLFQVSSRVVSPDFKSEFVRMKKHCRVQGH